MERPDDFEARAAAIVAGGLPCKMHCRRDGEFARIDLEPAPGSIHLARDEVIAEHIAMGSLYHISLSYTTLDEEVWRRVVDRWDGVELVIQIHYVNANGGAVLAWTGLGADPDVWALYTEGDFGYKWRDSHYGLHISM